MEEGVGFPLDLLVDRLDEEGEKEEDRGLS